MSASAAVTSRRPRDGTVCADSGISGERGQALSGQPFEHFRERRTGDDVEFAAAPAHDRDDGRQTQFGFEGDEQRFDDVGERLRPILGLTRYPGRGTARRKADPRPGFGHDSCVRSRPDLNTRVRGLIGGALLVTITLLNDGRTLQRLS